MELNLLQIPYTDDTGTTHEESVWLPTKVDIDLDTFHATVTWRGYHNMDAYLAGKRMLDTHVSDAPPSMFGMLHKIMLSSGMSVLDTVSDAVMVVCANYLADTPSEAGPVPFFKDAVRVKTTASVTS